MLPVTTIRGWQIEQLRKALQTMSSIFMSISADDAATYRDGGKGWTVLEVLCHLRDYESVFLERAQLTVEKEMPALPNPDPDALASERHYNSQALQAVYQEWVKRREVFLAYLAGLDEAAWARGASHPKRGPMSLQDQLALIAYHDVNHIEQITRIIAEKKPA